MKLASANKIRKQYIEELLAYFACEGSSDGEDCGMITSNSFNFPVVADDGEEGWVEIVVKIPNCIEDKRMITRVRMISEVVIGRVKLLS